MKVEVGKFCSEDDTVPNVMNVYKYNFEVLDTKGNIQNL